jgi:hypothetical protein
MKMRRVVVLYMCPPFGNEEGRKWIRYQRERQRNGIL